MIRKKVVYIERPINVTMYLLASLFLFLLTFFVILSSMSVLDGKRQKLAIGSIMGSFGILPGGRSAFNMNVGTKNLLPPTPPLQKGEIDISRIDRALSSNVSMSGIGVSEGKLGVTITIKAGILFEGQTDTLNPESRSVLETIADVLARMDNPVIITGHTDSIPVETPPYSSNWGLSAARAMAVLSYFESRGIQGSRLAAYGMGANRPMTSNSTEAGRRLNRRVEITLVGKPVGKVDGKGLERLDGPQDRSIFKRYNLNLEEQ
jgi:chemotaxis protein MotB